MRQTTKNRVIRSTIIRVAIAAGLLSPLHSIKSAHAATGAYCQFAPEEVAAKEQLLASALENNTQAAAEYQAIVRKHSLMLQQCRSQSWPEEQAVWLRLYPCDVSPGSLDYVLDRIVNLGYNKIHLEVFYDGQVLLPPADNPTPWIPVVRSPGAENLDLLQQTIAKGHQRGLKVYAWLFTMNFGYTYAQDPQRQDALARNATGDNSLTFVQDRSQAFIDPYSPQAKADYRNLVEAVLKRNPDGILFDYIRYPRGMDGYSAVSSVRDLWIYGKSSLQTMLGRAKNNKGRAAIAKYIEHGTITANDIAEIDRQYPDENADWQGRKIIAESELSLGERQRIFQSDLWLFSVAHAAQGILDFLSFAAAPAINRSLPAGAVFFPDANQIVGKAGFDSRLQAWDKFPAALEWHPMAYAVCEGTDCIAQQVKTVLQKAAPETKVTPALAGTWGQPYRDHPPLEAQMEALRKATPEINSVSHFAYSWQEPDIDRQRKFCDLQ
ncbi:family 10 glycosylhydrolase [Myxosarcina sp. GI1]|uniref:family 10 glycosylhydrolase n=1 Tax=Myxosarcina sp. GI1 TaxID=1541065 RepID=UPI000B33DAF6|nr:family 10 glycosylhydrolase [Myxosarcina sp. GI1]